MIKFFRNIRQRLLSNNKFTKYLLYAIGEIILVVIGILIALSINNWNDKKVLQKLELLYLNRLQTELWEDLERYKGRKLKFTEKKESVLSVLKVLNDSQFYINDSLQFKSDMFNGSGSESWYRTPTIWTQLIQSGDLNVLTNQDLVESLFDYYQSMEKEGDYFDQYPSQTTSEARKLISEAFHDSYKNLLIDDEIKEVSWGKAIKNIKQKKVDYSKIFVRSGILFKNYEMRMEVIINKTSKIIQDLENELKKQRLN